MGDALTGGNWGNSWTCPICKFTNSGAWLTCFQCVYKKPEKIDASPERVEETLESVRDNSTNSCQKSTELVETEQSQSADLSSKTPTTHRYTGSFGE